MPNMIHMTSATHGYDRTYYVVPFVYAYEDVSNAADATYFPLDLTLAEFVAMWWTWETINLAATIDHGTGLQTSLDVTLTRNAADEIALAKPGASTTDIIGLPLAVAGHFTGTRSIPNWNGLGGDLYLTASLRIGHWCEDDASANQDSAYECTQRLYWQDVAGVAHLHPSVIVDISYTITSPAVEMLFRLTNYTKLGAPPSVNANGGDVVLLGQTFRIGVLGAAGTDPHQIDVTLTPASYFTWGGVRSASTGAVNTGRFVRELLG